MFTREELLPGEDFFTKVPTHWIRDYRLTGNALKVLTFWASHQVGYDVSLKQTVAETGVGRDAVYAAVKCLRELDYVRLRQGRGAGGKMTEVEYTLGTAATTQTYERRWGAQQSNPSDEGKTAGRTAYGFAGSGQAGSGRAGSGQPAPKKIRVKEDQLKEDQTPLACEERPAPSPAEAQTGGINLDEETREILNDCAATCARHRTGQPGWSQRQIGEAMRAALEAGYNVTDVTTGMIVLAVDEISKFPTRLRPWLDVEAAKLADAGQRKADRTPAPSVTYIDPSRRRCPQHQDYPADNCRQHLIDAAVAAREAAEEAADAAALEALKAKAAAGDVVDQDQDDQDRDGAGARARAAIRVATAAGAAKQAERANRRRTGPDGTRRFGLELLTEAVEEMEAAAGDDQHTDPADLVDA